MSNEEIIRCPICLDDIELSNPGLISSRCGHVAHSSCLHASIRSGAYQCPICRQPFGDIPSSTDKALLRYVKMLKSGLLMAVVRQRMIVDRVSLSTIDAFFTGNASLAVQTEEDLVEEKIINFDKYRKMVVVGMDIEAVCQRMKVDGISSDKIDQFLSEY